jgi:hypothetical protein
MAPSIDKLRMRVNERRENSLRPMGLVGFVERIKAQRGWPVASFFFFDTLYIRLRGEGPSDEGPAR